MTCDLVTNLLAKTDPAQLGELTAKLQTVRSAVDRLGEAMPMWLDVLIGLGALWGVFMWLFGRRLVRPSMAMIGLSIGAIVGGLVGRTFIEGSAVILPVIVGGAVVGLIAWATWRLWVAVMLGVMLAAATPLSVLAWEGEPFPQAQKPIAQAVEDAANEAREAMEPGGQSSESSRDDLLANFKSAMSETWEAIVDWWKDDLDGRTRTVMTVGSGVMGVGGFVVGLILPSFAASLAASLVGSCFVVFSVLRLTSEYAGKIHEYLPSEPRGVLVCVGVMTVIGALIQWTIMGRRADN